MELLLELRLDLPLWCPSQKQGTEQDRSDKLGNTSQDGDCWAFATLGTFSGSGPVGKIINQRIKKSLPQMRDVRRKDRSLCTREILDIRQNFQATSSREEPRVISSELEWQDLPDVDVFRVIMSQDG